MQSMGLSSLTGNFKDNQCLKNSQTTAISTRNRKIRCGSVPSTAPKTVGKYFHKPFI